MNSPLDKISLAYWACEAWLSSNTSVSSQPTYNHITYVLRYLSSWSAEVRNCYHLDCLKMCEEEKEACIKT